MKLFVILFLFFIAASAWALQPVKAYVDGPDRFGFQYSQQSLPTADGALLNSWLCKPKAETDKKTTLILAYGDSGNMSYWLRQAMELVGHGYTIVLFDYRGFGASSDFEIDEDFLYYDEFVTDLRTVIQWTKAQRPDDQIGIWALSMGTIMTTLALPQQQVNFVVAEGFVSDPNRIVDLLKNYKQIDLKVPASASAYTAQLSRLKVPCLLFTGLKDGLTTQEESLRVKFLNEKSEIIPFRAGHLQGFQALSGATHGEKYIAAIDSFLTRIQAVKPTIPDQS